MLTEDKYLEQKKAKAKELFAKGACGVSVAAVLAAAILNMDTIDSRFTRASMNLNNTISSSITPVNTTYTKTYNGNRDRAEALHLSRIFDANEYDVIVNIENKGGFTHITLAEGTVHYDDVEYTPTFTKEIWDKIENGELKYTDSFVVYIYDDSYVKFENESLVQEEMPKTIFDDLDTIRDTLSYIIDMPSKEEQIR